MQISPKCCIVSAPLSAAAFALKCKAAQFYVSTRKHLQKQRPKAATYLCRFAAKARFDNRPPPRRVFPKREGRSPPSLVAQGWGIFKGEERSKLPSPLNGVLWILSFAKERKYPVGDKKKGEKKKASRGRQKENVWGGQSRPPLPPSKKYPAVGKKRKICHSTFSISLSP